MQTSNTHIWTSREPSGSFYDIFKNNFEKYILPLEIVILTILDIQVDTYS